jgi:hypothetical protein
VTHHWNHRVNDYIKLLLGIHVSRKVAGGDHILISEVIQSVECSPPKQKILISSNLRRGYGKFVILQALGILKRALVRYLGSFGYDPKNGGSVS